jgi:4-hydroxythreonine-4-phosphate dehydrogenase
MGDPSGIGPEITAKAWQELRKTQYPFFIIADVNALKPEFARQGLPAPKIISKPEQTAKVFPSHLPILQIDLKHPAISGTPNSQNGEAIIRSIKMAVGFCQSGQASALVTNPIAKSVLYKAGFSFAGHTEFLGALAGEFPKWPPPKGPVMMLCGGGLRVALVTIHTALQQVPSLITTETVENTVRVLHTALQQDFGIDHPRIAMCGLNPHAGEEASMGSEECDILNPLAAKLREQGMQITDALPADTLFRDDLRPQFDGVLAMYHDQGLIPVKTLDFHGGTNVTLGLPFVRVSPDHGTGFDIAGTGIARPDSLIAALKLASHLGQTRLRQS